MRADFIRTATDLNNEIFNWKVGDFEIAKMVPGVNTVSNVLRIIGAVILVAFSIFQVLGALAVGTYQWLSGKPVITADDYRTHGQWGVGYNLWIVVSSSFLGIPFIGNIPSWVGKCISAYKARQQGSVSHLDLGKSQFDLGSSLDRV